MNGCNRRRSTDDAEAFAFPPSHMFGTVCKRRSNMTASHRDGTISASLRGYVCTDALEETPDCFQVRSQQPKWDTADRKLGQSSVMLVA